MGDLKTEGQFLLLWLYRNYWDRNRPRVCLMGTGQGVSVSEVGTGPGR